MMGPRATASCGLVIAHHQTPLSLVLRELRQAEKSAKGFRRRVNGEEVDRDAWHMTILKRSGGRLDLSAEWGSALDLVESLREFLAAPGVSRRAVYNSLAWLHDLPATGDGEDKERLGALLAYQFERQADKTEKPVARSLAGQLADEALRFETPIRRLEQFLTVAEFLAREQRASAPQPTPAGAAQRNLS